MQDNNGDWWMSRRMRRKARKALISVIGVGLLFWAGSQMPIPGVDTGLTFGGVFWSTVFYLLVVLNSGWWFYVLMPWVRNRMVNICLFVVLFIFGSELYFFTPVDGNEEGGNVRLERQIQAPNRTIAAFFPSRGGYETVGHSRSGDRKSGGKGDFRRVAYFLFHSAVLFYVALLMFAVFGRGFVNRVLKCCVRHRKLNVFWGRSDAAILLARSILNGGSADEVFFSLDRRLGDGDDRKKLTSDLDGIDVLWAFNDDTDECDLDEDSSFGLAKGYRHFFFSDSVHANLIRANRVVCLYKDIGKPHDIWWCLRHPHSYVRRRWKRPYLYVRVKTPQEEETYATWAANVRKYVNPVVVQESRLIARSLLTGDDSLLKMPSVQIDGKNGCVVKGEFRFLLIGFGSCGQDVLQELICNGQFLRSRGQIVPFAVDVVEKDEAVVGQYKRAHPGLCEMYHVNFKGGIRVETEEFDKWVMENIAKYGRIIVCLNGDAMNMGIASQIVEVARCNGKSVKKNVIYAKVSDHIRNMHAPKGRMWTIFSNGSDIGPEQVPIRFFGDLKNIYRMSELDAEKADEMAKVLNVWYCKGEIPRDRQTIEDEWNKAPVFNQMSSRASAEGHRNLLALLGYEAVSAGDLRPEAELPGALFEGKSALVENLAETEHLRWCAFHVTRGFRCWDVLGSGLNVLDVDEIRKQNREGLVRANQLAYAGRHADLVPYNRLPDVDLKLARLNDEACAKKREDFIGENDGATQLHDIAFCRLIPDVAHAAGLKIVRIEV